MTIENSWPNGHKQGISQGDHEKWNAYNYPGTKQLCSNCEQPTGNCEEDSVFNEDGNPICDTCKIMLDVLCE